MKKFVVLAAAAALVGVSSLASANTVTISATNGTWQNVTGGTADINNGGDPRTVRWPASALTQSGYDYSPTATPFAATVDGAAFLLGTFAHQNFPIFNSITGVDLNFSLAWAGFAPPLAGIFQFAHEETPNNANPCAYGGANFQGENINGCADRVSITSPFLNTQITDGTNTYFFTLVGFSTDGGNTTSLEYLTRENATNTAGLYGRLTSVRIPEPGTMLMLGLGLVAVGARLRRRR
jgi:hypothetical protein